MTGTSVTDEERTTYGLLLDRAAERGLIGPADYEVRLRELAEATTVEELRRIVTELPAFSAAPVAARGGRAPGTRRVIGAGARGGSNNKARTSPWLLLAVMVVVLAASLVVLAIFVAHLGHAHNSGLPPSVAAAQSLSALRL